MNKNDYAPIAPMGWNSYDYYDTTVNEEQVRANAAYLAEHLKDAGYEYVVVDIEWYAKKAGSQRNTYQYIPYSDLAIDEYSRLQPDPERFPSSADGTGFKALADYVHSLGLKFGIHIMRGIPRIAAHTHMAVKKTDWTANQIADPSSICGWNPDMYGVRNCEAGQAYYDSLLEMYAEWGVDFIKCDDICRMDMPTAKEEIRMLSEAIEKCGRPIVLSLSPGPAKIEEAWYYETHANMWRITDDFWDDWQLLVPMFERCELWQSHVTKGCYPDCDMLPVGKLGKGFADERDTRFTKEEQITMMTLWSVFRSPMMIGADLPQLDDWTKSLLTNADVLHLLSHSSGARQMMRDNRQVVWCTKDTDGKHTYIAVFNLQDQAGDVSLPWDAIERYGITANIAKELWSGDQQDLRNCEAVSVAAHGAKLFRL